MTPAERALRARCQAAGLTVLGVETVGAQVRVTVKKAPLSASGLQGLAVRLGVTGMTADTSDAAGNVRLWFMSEDGAG